MNDWVQNKNPAMNDVTAGYKICTRQFTSYQGCRFLLHSASSFIQTGLYKDVIAGKQIFECLYKGKPSLDHWLFGVSHLCKKSDDELAVSLLSRTTL